MVTIGSMATVMGGDYREDASPKKHFVWGDANASVPQQLLLLVKNRLFPRWLLY